ncbi:hypothetical protein [Proteus mirabilis]|uniref:hypothetical protein n=1 Tax=Proteus mirabilis TaxID=584 RepID=UPI00236124BB|nr:hypothetical protein [Proteus mirabilis]MDC9767432.1 hypothetical protein [Proteus mirabilis]
MIWHDGWIYHATIESIFVINANGSFYVLIKAYYQEKKTLNRKYSAGCRNHQISHFGDYMVEFTSTFTSPTLLDTSPVNSVNCTQGGKNYITIKAYNSLVSGNMSGMLLNGTKSNNQSEVYVVASLKNLTNQTCQANDTSAIRFFDGHYIPNMDNIKSFNQTFLFGLCANGKVIADKYSGAVDVSFIVE